MKVKIFLFLKSFKSLCHVLYELIYNYNNYIQCKVGKVGKVILLRENL